MSKKFLSRAVAAILMMAIITSMFLGGTVSAETVEATYDIKCSVELQGDTEAYALVTFTAAQNEPFSAVDFIVDSSEVLAVATNGSCSASTADPIALVGAEFVSAEMSDGGVAFVPEIGVSGPTEEFPDDPYAVLAVGDGAKDNNVQDDTRRFYNSLTLRLKFEQIDGPDNGTGVSGLGTWNRYVVKIDDINMSGENSKTYFNVTNSDSVTTSTESAFEDYIHVHTYSRSIGAVNKEEYYEFYDTTCRLCSTPIKQVRPDDATRTMESRYAVRGINTYYNESTDTLDINILTNKRDGYNFKLIVCPSDGYKYHQFGGNSEVEGAQSRENISVIEGEEEGGYIKFTFTGAPARHIGDDLLFTVLADNGTSFSCGPTKAYSIADYCYEVVNGTAVYSDGSTPTAADKALFASLLDYGAAAQTYAGETATANAELAEELKNAYNAVTLSQTNTEPENIAELADCKVHTTSLILRTNASLKFQFAFNGEYKQNEKVEVTFKNGEETLATVNATQMQYDEKSGRYHAYTLDIGSRQMRTPITVTITYDGTEMFVGTYSVEGYAIKAQAKLDEATTENNIAKYTKLSNVAKALVYYNDMLLKRFPVEQ